MDRNELTLYLEKKLNKEFIGQREFFKEISEYFINKVENNEKGILVIAGHKNTFKKASIKTIFEELYEKNLMKNKNVDEIDLASYNFNMGYNAFLTDLYEKLDNDKSDGLMFKNTEKASEEVIKLLSNIYPNTCIQLNNDYIIKNKFLVEAKVQDKNKINKIVCHNKFFIFIYNYEDKNEFDDFSQLSLKNREKIFYTRELTQKEKNIIIRKKLINEIEKIKSDFGVQVLLGFKDNVNEKEVFGVCQYLQKNFNKNSGFDITEYIYYKVSDPLRNFILKESIEEGEKILIYVNHNRLYCKANNEIYRLNKYSTPTLDDVRYKLESIIGVKQLKEFLLNIENNYKVQKIREKLGLRTSRISLNMIFAGNAGTGKTNAARITYEYLNALGLLSTGVFIEVSKADFITENVNETAKRTNDIINSAIGGVLFIDEAYALCESEDDKVGKEIVDALLKGIEDNRNNLTVILAGYEKDMEEFLSFNQGLKSRFPNIIHFEDYKPEEMYEIAMQIAKAKGYRIAKNVKNDLIDLFARNQLTGKNDLGNARFVRNIIENAIIYSSRKYLTNNKSEIDLLEGEDFNFKASAKFDLEEKLKGIIGLEDVKNLLRSQYKLLVAQEKRKSVGVNTEIEQNLNMVFAGNPGTGKTSIARLVAQMLNSMGLLKVGQLVETDRSSFVANIPGETAKKTEEKFKEALGGVLFIDEAYSLMSSENDPLGKEAVDTLVKLIEDFREDIIVILVGYDKEMKEFLNTNSGLRSRFPLNVNFKDYEVSELLQIGKLMIKSKGFVLAGNSEDELEDAIRKEKQKSGLQSGNGRMVRNIIEKAIREQSSRIAGMDIVDKDSAILLTEEDFGVYVKSTNDFNLDEELNKVVGLTEVKDFIRSLQAQLKIQEQRKFLGLPVDESQTLHMIFKGNPGTGKTTMARIVGEVLYNIGVLNSKTFVETDRSGLVAGYVGQTAIKTKEKLESALGGIIFIDEAYSLSQDGGSGSNFGKEAIDTLVKVMDDNRDNLLVILAGYSNDMENFLETNPGLKSRFANIIEFKDYSVEDLLTISDNLFKGKGYILTEEARNKMGNIFEEACKVPDFGNGRYVRNVFEKIVRNQAVRLEKINNLTKDNLITIEACDVSKVDL